ncbi:MAG: hypothetical protein IPK26_28475 [Planctomycetes bacterium]|nr:hypothetical protein [Planctomycetota bacterium]
MPPCLAGFAAAAADPRQGDIVLYSHESPTTSFFLGRWNGTAWASYNAAPVPIWGYPAIAYDEVRDEFVLSPGSAPAGAGTWVLTRNGLQLRSPADDSRGYGATSMVQDTNRDRLLFAKHAPNGHALQRLWLEGPFVPTVPLPGASLGGEIELAGYHAADDSFLGLSTVQGTTVLGVLSAGDMSGGWVVGPRLPDRGLSPLGYDSVRRMFCFEHADPITPTTRIVWGYSQSSGWVLLFRARGNGRLRGAFDPVRSIWVVVDPYHSESNEWDGAAVRTFPQFLPRPGTDTHAVANRNLGVVFVTQLGTVAWNGTAATTVATSRGGLSTVTRGAGQRVQTLVSSGPRVMEVLEAGYLVTPSAECRLGQGTAFTLTSPNHRGQPWLVGLSTANYPGIPIGFDPNWGLRTIPLAADWLLPISLSFNLGGVLDAAGTGQTTLHLPNATALDGFAFHAAAITLGPIGIDLVSNALALHCRP